MFQKREDGLGGLLLPYETLGLVMAVLCTVWSGARGLWVVPVFFGSWLGWFLALLIGFVLFAGVLSLTVDMKAPPPKEDHPFYRRVVVYIIGLLCRVGRLRLHITGGEKLPEGRFLIVSNHRSGYDPIATVWALRRRDIAFIMKPEVLRIPIAGPMIYKSNYLPIDRSDPRRAMDTIRTAADHLKNDVVSVGVYPEGTRSRDGALLPFHSGVFKIAQKAGAPVVVASITGTEGIWTHYPWRRTDVYLNICAVLPPDELGGTSAAAGERVREIIERDLAAREG